MKFYTIEIDEKVWNYLKKNAEPFKDTPNSVLNRIIFGQGAKSVSPISLISEPDKNQTTKIEIRPDNDLIVDGIKLELEDTEKKIRPLSLNTARSNTTRSSRSDEIESLQLEIESKFDTGNKGMSTPFEQNLSLNPDKDIDDFINELEKSNSSMSLRDEFSKILKEIPGVNGEWKEISIKPKQEEVIEHPSQTLKPSFKQPPEIPKRQPSQLAEKPPEKKKPKLLSIEDKLIYSLGERLKNQWGEFRQEGIGLLIFANKTVLCKFSKYDEENNRWFWGVSQADRYAWGPQNWLALILENEDQRSFSFLLFNSQESGVLFDQCRQTTGDKYINMLMDEAYESPRIQEWRHLDLRNRKKALPLYNPGDE